MQLLPSVDTFTPLRRSVNEPIDKISCTQVIAAFTISLVTLAIGFAAAYPSPALASMYETKKTEFKLTPQMASWIGGIMPLSALAGSIIGGPVIDYLGRKATILVTAVPFVIGWLLIATATNVIAILAGRASTGLSVGIASMSLPIYLSETLQPQARGTLGLIPTAFGDTGILICFVAGGYLNWSHLAYIGATLAVPFFILMFMLPETPCWYIERNQTEHARRSLNWLRRKNTDVQPELEILMEKYSQRKRQSLPKELILRENFKPIGISLGLMFFQQFSGINAVIYYTVWIFRDTDSTIEPRYCTMVIGGVNLFATFIATSLIDRVGRKVLLCVSSSIVTITLLALGGIFYCKENDIHMSPLNWLPLVCFIIYIIGFSLGLGPIPWLMMGEISPTKIRGMAASITTAFNWICTCVVTITFQNIIDLIGHCGTFWLFASITAVSLVFFIVLVPETRGQTLEDIQEKIANQSFKEKIRLSSVANIRPLSFNM